MKYTVYKFTDGHTATVIGKWSAWQIRQEEAAHGKLLWKREKKM